LKRLQILNIAIASILLGTVLATARPSPVYSEKQLDTKTTNFRNLIVDCTERSKSLSCHRAGVYYIDIRKDYKNGIEFLNNACNLGRGYSCTLAGDYYRQGKIVKKDLIVAKSFYNKGCIRESQDGCKKFNEINSPIIKKKTFSDYFHLN